MIIIVCPYCKEALEREDERGLHLMKKCPICGNDTKFKKAVEDALAGRAESIEALATKIGKTLREIEVPEDLPMDKLIQRIVSSGRYRPILLEAIIGASAKKSKKAKKKKKSKE